MLDAAVTLIILTALLVLPTVAYGAWERYRATPVAPEPPEPVASPVAPDVDDFLHWAENWNMTNDD